VRAADVVVGLDWVDLGGTLEQAYGDEPVAAKVVHCSCDFTLHRGWSKDHFALPPVDVSIAAHPDRLVSALLERRVSTSSASDRPTRHSTAALGAAAAPGPDWDAVEIAVAPAAAPEPGLIGIGRLAESLAGALDGRRTCLVRLPLGWQGADLDLSHPLDYLGQDGGAGLGSGPGMAIGAALALQGDDRLAVAVLGDGDTLMGANALWTAPRERQAVLIVVANNRSFFNDEVHQERVALVRNRPVENRHVGQHIRDPDPDLAALARSLGLEGFGPVTDPDALDATLAEAVAAAAAGAAVLVDVRVTPHGYPGGPGPSRAAEGAIGASTQAAA
jgi:thiamine pyrophosphate-dependent enzyme